MWRAGINGSIILALTLYLATVHIGRADCDASPCQDWYEIKYCDDYPSCLNGECVACRGEGETCSDVAPCCADYYYCDDNDVCRSCIALENVCGGDTPCCEPYSCFESPSTSTKTGAQVLTNSVAVRIIRPAVLPSTASMVYVRTALLKMMVVETITSLAVTVIPASKVCVRSALTMVNRAEIQSRTAMKARPTSVGLVRTALLGIGNVEGISRTAAKVIPAFKVGVLLPYCRECTKSGDYCGYSVPGCCEGTCFNSLCTACTAVGSPCGDDCADCCEGYTCFDNECRACTSRGADCGDGYADCCEGLTCYTYPNSPPPIVFGLRLLGFTLWRR